jgi:hypothetical protein
MTKKKRILQTIETRRVLIVRSGGGKLTLQWCESCSARRYFFTVEHAAVLSGLSQRQLFQAVESGRLHISDIGGRAFLCVESLGEMRPQTKEFFSTFRDY